MSDSVYPSPTRELTAARRTELALTTHEVFQAFSAQVFADVPTPNP